MRATLIRDVLKTGGNSRSSDLGWATASLEQSLRRAVMLLATVTPLVLGVTLIVAAPPEASFRASSALLFAVASFAVVCLFLPTINALWPLLLTMAATTIVYWISPGLDHAVTFAGAWVTNFTSVAVVLLVRGWPALALSAVNGGLCAVVILLAHPDWPPTLTQGAPVTQVAIGICGLFAMHYFRAFANSADIESAAAERDRRAAAVAATASRASAEAARILHDTVINTLGAIANGGRVMSDRSRVRVRCTRDIASIDELLSGDLVVTRDDWELVAAELCADVGIEPHISVLSKSDVTLGQPVVTALYGALREALLNVAKHSGVAHVSIDIDHRPERLTIVVADSGVGHAGELGEGFGIRESILARCRDSAIDVQIRTSAGQGTSVRFEYVSGSASEPAGDDDFEQVVASTQNRACWTWSWCVTGVGVAIEFTNHFGTFGMTWGMIGVLAVSIALAQYSCRGGRSIPVAVQGVLIVTTPVTFVLSLAGVGYGRQDVILWQLLGTTAPIIILLYQSRTVWPAVAAAVAHVAVGAMIVVAMFDESTVGLVVLGVLVPLLAVAGFVLFHGEIERIGAHTVADQRSAAAARHEVEVRKAADNARARWKVAGLHAARDLLARIVGGSVSPTDRGIAASCAAEERYLRQLLMLSPELLHLGYWFTRASALARARGVELSVRAGDIDVASPAVAELIGKVVLDEIAASPPDSKVTLGLFATEGAGSVTVVRDQCTDSGSATFTAMSGLRIESLVLGDQRMVEIAWGTPDREVALAGG